MAIDDQYTDSTLFKRVSESDEQAFNLIFDRYWPQVYGTTLHLTKKTEEARDLSQDIFIKLWENRSRLKDIVNPSSYLYTISRNLVIDHLRKNVFDPSNTDFLLNYFQSAASTPQEMAEYRELHNLLNNAVEALPGKIKEVFILSRYKGLTHEQIAAALGISVVSSKTYIVRALQLIRKFMLSHADTHLIWMAFVLLLQR
ncbi:hypothetical protein A8C56_01555 [Niabella ginsenosidivorans]|uniref:RNA polymerase subunit sigma-24 n=1 Tax=Niabella ginsenosidivorans TaxID=1176587 RepID=A0A1A9HZU0_9BACT|nr:sigma-70 family RNA polymerase sigma factor [Niabella ginsenosidivorans]ANH79834.1 hypothetical protein A8C56_01555 [Niabella ginsenosidivorans]